MVPDSAPFADKAAQPPLGEETRVHRDRGSKRQPSAVCLRFTADISAPSAVIFDLLADMPNYGEWLPGSQAFGATEEVSPYPVRLGTTYLDWGPAGQRPGSVIEFDRPNRLGFHQTMALKRGPLNANIDIIKRYVLEKTQGATRVECSLDMTVEMRGIMAIARPLVVHAFRHENLRVLAALKAYVERSAPGGTASR